jgi:hypothetical protein
MKSINLRSAAGAAIAIATAAVLTLHAQGPQSGPPSATAQSPTNVNVVNVPTVTVGNTELQAIPVKGPAKRPVYASFNATIPVSIGLGTIGTYTVPTGQRLVVEHFSASCRSESQNYERAQLVHDGVILTFLPMTSIPFLAFPGQELSSGAVPVSALIDEGTLTLEVIRTSPNNSTFCVATVLGYLTPPS